MKKWYSESRLTLHLIEEYLSHFVQQILCNPLMNEN